MTLIFTQGHSCIEIKNFGVLFLAYKSIDLRESQLLPQPGGLLKLMLNLFFAQVILKGENCAGVIWWNMC